MDPTPRLAERVAAHQMAKAPFIAFTAVFVALLAVPNPFAIASGGFSPLVSLFIAGLTSAVLPPGWLLIYSSSAAEPEVYIAASITLALLVSSPIISYQIMKSIATPTESRKATLYRLVAWASILLVAGTLIGTFSLARYFLVYPFYAGQISLAPIAEASSFYFYVLRIIGTSALAFTLPVYVYALVRFRLPKKP
jgi:Sec-independent protein secretion pathway component TatC